MKLNRIVTLLLALNLFSLFQPGSAEALILRAYSVAGSGEFQVTAENEFGLPLGQVSFLAVEGLSWASSTFALAGANGGGPGGPGTPLDDPLGGPVEYLGNLGDQTQANLSLPDVQSDVDPGAIQFDPAGNPFNLFVVVDPGSFSALAPGGAGEIYLGALLINGDETNPQFGFLDSSLDPISFGIIIVPEPATALLLGLGLLGLLARKP